MALALHIKCVENLRGRADRLCKVAFRGVCHYSKVIENVDDRATVDELFEWPVARPIVQDEVIEIGIYNYNKYLSNSLYKRNKLVGTFRMVLQQLVEVGNVSITDCMIDDNNVLLKTSVTFELTYTAPDGSVGQWGKEAFEHMEDDGGGGRADDERHLLHPDDEDSRPSSPSKSMRGSRLSISSRTSQTLKSPTKARSPAPPSVLISPAAASTSRASLSSSSGRQPPRSPARSPVSPMPPKSPAKSPTRGSSPQPFTSMKSMKSMVKMMKLGKQRPPPDDEERQSLMDARHDDSHDHGAMEDRYLIVPRGGGHDYQDDDTRSDSQASNTAITGPVITKNDARSKPQARLEHGFHKAQDFQVCITIIEARQLAGLNMDPVVCVQVGDQKKYTSVKEATNCPYYNEYFVFDFHMAPAMLFDKIITLTALHSRNILRAGTVVGQFKFDIGTVYAASDHQFYHKWAMLTDPDDINGGPKGYLKCDIAVVGKGDSIKTPPKTDKDEDDIEANLLLPDGVPAERQRARFLIRIYKAEGLPRMVTSVMATVKKAFTGEAKDLVDPYVSVSFAGHKGKTSVKKGSYEPIWNEQIVFTDMFPPLCRRLCVQLRDSDGVNDDVIGTHFIDLPKISNEGGKGFLPTFGPCWVNLYGSTRNYSLLEEHAHLNQGMGEGVSFRARLLVSFKTEILDAGDTGPSMVEVENCLPVSESAAGRPEQFFLFGSILEATMIDKKVGEKPIQFELSIGNYGNSMDGQNQSVGGGEESEEEGEKEEEEEKDPDEPEWHSCTDPIKPTTRDKYYYHLPMEENRPILWVKAVFEDHRRRMYMVNQIEKIIDKLEDGLSDVHEMVRQERPFPERRLRGVLEELALGCSRFQQLNQGKSAGAGAGRTKLDKERHRLCMREVDQCGMMGRTLKATVSKTNMRDKLKAAGHLVGKLQHLAEEPQHALPDAFLWMISNGKRVAYQRIKCSNIIYSMVDEERGKDAGKVQTLFLKLPGKRSIGQSGWAVQAKVQVYLWLGVTKHKKEILKGVPGGYEDTPQLRRTLRIVGTPPNFLHYTERQVFQLRAHMYQARSLIGSDNSGLSDPFARIIFGDQSQCTQVIDETLSPTWDEMLIFNEIILYGNVEEIKEEPPTIVIEIFDQDRVGKAEFIGRALAKPVVKMSHEKYERPAFPPNLEWFEVYRGPDRAGELLAAFELLQLAPHGDSSGLDLPPMELPDIHQEDRGPIMPVPKGIRPTLSKYRVEVLFWGVRDLKRIQFTSVDHPRIDIECAGQVLSSSVIIQAKKNPNFSVPVKFFDVELPDNELYCPPVTIRCVDCRNFGRFILAGTHVINNISKFMYIPTTRTAEQAFKKFLGRGSEPASLRSASMQQARLSVPVSVMNMQLSGETSPSGQKALISTKADDVAITIDEKAPLISKEQLVTIDTGPIEAGPKKKKSDLDEPKKKKVPTATLR